MKVGFSHIGILAVLLMPLFFTACDKSRLNSRMNMVGHKADRGMASVMGQVTMSRRNYDYLQKSGGLVVEDPVVMEDGSIFLPVYANIRGASNIVGKPDTQRGKASIREIVYEIDENDPTRLYIYAKTSRENRSAPSALVQGVNFGNLAPGDYSVEYKNRNNSLMPISAFRVE